MRRPLASEPRLTLPCRGVTDDELLSLEGHLQRTIDRVFEERRKLFLQKEERQRRSTESPSKWNSVVSFFSRSDAGNETPRFAVVSPSERSSQVSTRCRRKSRASRSLRASSSSR